MKWTYFLILLLFFACKPNTGELPAPVDETSTTSPGSFPTTKSLPPLSDLTLTVDNLKLRVTPGSDGRELMRLPEKSVVVPTGKTTDLKQQVSLRGLSYNEPWLQVSINEDVNGWIYGGAADLDPEASEFSKKLFKSRTNRFFGNISEELADYRTAFHGIKTAADLQIVYESGRGLHEAANRAFSKRCRVGEMPMDLSLNWVAEAFPGYTLTLVAEGTEIAFLPNLNEFIEMAAKTPEKDDDKALDFLKQLNGNYSILLFFRDWYNQTTDYGGLSLLGIGKHFQYLSEAEALNLENNVFLNGIIQRECNLMVDDIVNNEAGYARDKASIVAEIEKIIAADLTILNPEQKTAITNRIIEFDNPEANKIKVNEKIGVQ